MFYFGYLFWEYPTNRLLQRLPLAKYSAFNVIMWGLTLCCMAAVQNFAGAMTGTDPFPSIADLEHLTMDLATDPT